MSDDRREFSQVTNNRYLQMYQFVDGREILKPPAVRDSRCQKIYVPLNDRSCGIAQTNCQSSRIVIEENIGLESCSELDFVRSCSGQESLCPVPDQTTTTCKLIKVHAVTLSSPSTILSFTENASQTSHVSRVIDSDQQPYNESEASRVLQNVHISAQLMEDFLELAKDNTKKDLETCGVLGAFLERGTFYVTTLIIPKQESSSNSVTLPVRNLSAMNDSVRLKMRRKFLPYKMNGPFIQWDGYMYTHPSQSCFMSSIDLHTQYSYQVMVPEAFAIVVAPTDNSRSYGIFRVSDPSGMSVLKECQEKGCQFHSHKETENGSPIYEHCTHVYKNSNLRFEIFDLR
ncbi:JAB1/MPN/MOV34 metalloenzyme domain - like 4 [Theobroma cacao]|nr:JAB1/MPN/MOV34 metalloenzyme domain - like 4 [Theobroma cacao]